MAALSDYAERRLGDLLLRNGAEYSYGGSGTVYVGLFTAAPSDSGGGTEVSGGSYARQSVAFNAISTATDGEFDNTSTIQFPDATASWGTITHFGIFDASTGGNLLVHGILDTSRTVASGDDVYFSAGALKVTFA